MEGVFELKRIAYLFPGQGSQAVGMGKSFVENFESAKQLLESATTRLGIDFEQLLFNPNDRLEQTQYTQPAILLVSAMAFDLYRKEVEGKPELAIGHSLGEFGALCSVGAMAWLDAVSLVHLRGKLMREACQGRDAGMMVALGLNDDVVEGLCDQAREAGKSVWPANYNAKGQIVIAGLKEDLRAMEPVLKEAGAKRALVLNMSVASHCPILQSAVGPLRSGLSEALKETFDAPVISNVTAKPYQSKAEALELLGEQLVMPVRYSQSIANVDAQVDAYIEFGHGGVLKGLNRRATKKPTYVVSDADSLKQTVEALSE